LGEAGWDGVGWSGRQGGWGCQEVGAWAQQCPSPAAAQATEQQPGQLGKPCATACASDRASLPPQTRQRLPTLRLWMAAQMRRPEAMKASTKPRQPTMVHASHLRAHWAPNRWGNHRAGDWQGTVAGGAAAGDTLAGPREAAAVPAEGAASASKQWQMPRQEPLAASVDTPDSTWLAPHMLYAVSFRPQQLQQEGWEKLHECANTAVQRQPGQTRTAPPPWQLQQSNRASGMARHPGDLHVCLGACVQVEHRGEIGDVAQQGGCGAGQDRAGRGVSDTGLQQASHTTPGSAATPWPPALNICLHKSPLPAYH